MLFKIVVCNFIDNKIEDFNQRVNKSTLEKKKQDLNTIKYLNSFYDE